MRREKKLFLLAMLTLLMSTEGYSEKIIENNEKKIISQGTGYKVQKDEKLINNNDIIVNNGTGVYVSADKGKTAKVDNKGSIEINGGTGLNIQSGEVNNFKEIIINKANNGITLNKEDSKFFNKNGASIIINEGATKKEDHNGIKIDKGLFENSGKIENSDKITINGGELNNKEELINKEKGRINISGGKLISSGSLTNKGEIEINSSKNISEIKGQLLNKSKITLNSKENEIALQQTTNGNIENERELNINSSGTNSIGIEIKNGIFNNTKDGTININISGKGEKTSGLKQTDGKIINEGNIIINSNGGKYSSGIHINGGNFINNKDILINEASSTSYGIKQDKGTLENNGNIIVNKGVGVKLSLEGNFTNKTGIIEVKNDATGIDQSGGTFTNSGEINVSGIKAIGIKTSKGTSTNNGEGHIYVNNNSATGMYSYNGGKIVNNGNIFIGNINGAGEYSVGMKAYSGDGKSSSQAINNNMITITGNGTTSNGMTAEVTKANGTASIVNNRIIKASKVNTSAMAAKGKGATATNEKNGTIIILEDAIGMKIESDAVGTNNGQIKISKGTGVTVNGGSFTNEGIIAVEGQKSIGINVSNGTANNKGSIIVGTKDKGADQYSVGMKAYSGDNKSKSEAINSNSIIIIGNGKDTANGMAAEVANKVSGAASIKNNGTIEASGKSISAMAAKRKGAMAINETNGDISVFDAATGMKIEENASGINKGVINVNNPNAIGVTLSDGSFINEGTIKAEKDGIAIKSIKGNNLLVLKNGSSIEGKILGASGVDNLKLEAGKYSNLNINNYETIIANNGDIQITDSTIGLDYNKESKKVLSTLKGDKGNLKLSNSNIVIDLKNKKADVNKDELGVMLDGNKIKFENVKFSFKSNDKDRVFDMTNILEDITDGKLESSDLEYLSSIDTAVWSYSKNEEGHWIANKKTFSEISKKQLNAFAHLLDQDNLPSYTSKLEFLSQAEYDNALTQMSGGVHGYAVDFAAINARTMVNTMRERALTRDYLRNRPINSWTQDIMYVDNNHRLGGLMDVNYNEKGVLGISEKQILKNGRLGLVYGGTNGNAKFEGGENGSIKLDGAYFGGYYNHEFNPNWSLNSNVNFVYTHDRVTRNVKFADINETFKSSYPTYTVGLGSSLIYTVKDDLKNKAHFYAGIDVERLMIGNINENIDQEKDTTGLAVKTNSGGEKTYYSIVPSAGFMVQNTGYVFDKKYRIGADLNWETEVGDIKDGKRLSLTGINGEYKVETSKRENVFSYSLFGALDLTEDLAINAKYTSMFSDEYNSDMIGAGFEYKIDTMADNVFGNFAHKLENSRPFSDRWGGTLGVMLETEDGNDVTYYSKPGGFPTSGDYATSTQYKPKMTLSLNDKKSNWGYYFETYYKNNSMLQGHKAGEEKQHASRIHGEVRWSDTYSRGKYGVNVAYRNEKSKKPSNSYQFWGTTSESAVHELRLTPNFSYSLTNNITFGGKTTFVASYNYDGDRKDQTDFSIENQYGISYSGFMPRWQLSLIYFREDRFYDNSFRKLTGYDKKTDTYKYGLASERYQNNQLRPSITYYFGNGAALKFDTRITLGNGAWYNEKDTHIKKSESYETRYSFDYSYPVAPGFTVNFGGSFLNNKSKSRTKDNRGNTSRDYSFRPNIGFSYSF